MPFIKKAELETLRAELSFTSMLWASTVINYNEKLPRIRRAAFIKALTKFQKEKSTVFADFNDDSLAFDHEFDSNDVLQHMFAVHPVWTIGFIRCNIDWPGQGWDLFTLRNYCNTFLKS